MKKVASKRGDLSQRSTSDNALAKSIEIAKSVGTIDIPPRMMRDALAVAGLRAALDKSFPPAADFPKDWTFPEIEKLLLILKDFLGEVHSEPIPSVTEGQLVTIVSHTAYDLLSQLIISLNDLKKGIIDEHLRGQTNVSGSSLKSLERQRIGFALLTVEILRKAKNLTLEKALKETALVLQKNGYRIGGRPMTAGRIKEWAKVYDTNGERK